MIPIGVSVIVRMSPPQSVSNRSEPRTLLTLVRSLHRRSQRAVEQCQTLGGNPAEKAGHNDLVDQQRAPHAQPLPAPAGSRDARGHSDHLPASPQPPHHLNVFKNWPGGEPAQRLKQLTPQEQALVPKRGVQPAASEVDYSLHQATPRKTLTECKGKSAASDAGLVEALGDQARITRRDQGVRVQKKEHVA